MMQEVASKRWTTDAIDRFKVSFYELLLALGVSHNHWRTACETKTIRSTIREEGGSQTKSSLASSWLPPFL